MATTITFNALMLDQLVPAVRVHFEKKGQPAPSFQTGDWPQAPGVYVWCDEQSAVLYIGSAAKLSRRLGDEKRWVEEHDPSASWAPTVVHFLHQRRARVSWLSTAGHAEAKTLERRLIEWHRTTVGCAPLLSGWAPARASGQLAELRWAQSVWNRNVPLHRSWDPESAHTVALK